MVIRQIEGRYAVVRLPPTAPMPEWGGREFFSVTRTREELSIVALEDRVPEGHQAETGWSLLAVDGPLEFSIVGVLSSLTGALASAGVSVFAISTFDTDYLLVGEGVLGRACAALEAAGHRVLPRTAAD